MKSLKLRRKIEEEAVLVNKVFPQWVNNDNSIFNTSSTPSWVNTSVEDIKDLLNKHIRPGVGSRSKLIVCHPDNLEEVRKLTKFQTENPDIHIPFPYRVITNKYVPKTAKMRTGKILWKKDRFTDWSGGPTSDMSEEEYLEMCLYFGYAEYEEKEDIVFYEVDDKKLFDLKKFII